MVKRATASPSDSGPPLICECTWCVCIYLYWGVHSIIFGKQCSRALQRLQSKKTIILLKQAIENMSEKRLGFSNRKFKCFFGRNFPQHHVFFFFFRLQPVTFYSQSVLFLSSFVPPLLSCSINGLLLFYIIIAVLLLLAVKCTRQYVCVIIFYIQRC